MSMTKPPQIPPFEEFRQWLDSLPADRQFNGSFTRLWSCNCPVASFLTTRNGELIQVGKKDACVYMSTDLASLDETYQRAIQYADALISFVSTKFTAGAYRAGIASMAPSV